MQVSRDLVSRVTDKVAEELAAWQSHRLTPGAPRTAPRHRAASAQACSKTRSAGAIASLLVDQADTPVAIRACWLSWFAVATTDQTDLVRRLGLVDMRPTTWADGVDLIDEVAHGGEGRFTTVVATPAIGGWTLVVGAWFGLPYQSRTSHVTQVCQQFSAQFGKAQAYFHSEQNDGEAWLIAEDGLVRRRWISHYPQLSIGEPFGVERQLLDAFGITGKPEDLDPDNDLAGEWRATWGDCYATTVAAESSIDPTEIGPDTVTSGALLVARTQSD